MKMSAFCFLLVLVVGCENPYKFEKLCPGQKHLNAAEISKLVTAVEETETKVCVSVNGGAPLWGGKVSPYTHEPTQFYCVTAQEKREVEPPFCNRQLLTSMACPNTKLGYCHIE